MHPMYMLLPLEVDICSAQPSICSTPQHGLLSTSRAVSRHHRPEVTLQPSPSTPQTGATMQGMLTADRKPERGWCPPAGAPFTAPPNPEPFCVFSKQHSSNSSDRSKRKTKIRTSTVLNTRMSTDGVSDAASTGRIGGRWVPPCMRCSPQARSQNAAGIHLQVPLPQPLPPTAGFGPCMHLPAHTPLLQSPF